MRVEQRLNQSSFDAISSRLRMYKTPAFGMLIAEFYLGFNSLKK